MRKIAYSQNIIDNFHAGMPPLPTRAAQSLFYKAKKTFYNTLARLARV